MDEASSFDDAICEKGEHYQNPWLGFFSNELELSSPPEVWAIKEDNNCYDGSLDEVSCNKKKKYFCGIKGIFVFILNV